jgi:lipopolysaccharide transport system ATP-binding protein
MGDDLKRWWAKCKRAKKILLKIGDVNNAPAASSSDYVWALKDINFSATREVLVIIGKRRWKIYLPAQILQNHQPNNGSINLKVACFLVSVERVSR